MGAARDLNAGPTAYEVDNFEVVYGGLRVYRNAVVSYARERLLASGRDQQQLDAEVQQLFIKEWSGILKGIAAALERGTIEVGPVDALDSLSVNHLQALFEKFWSELCPLDDPNMQDAKKVRSSILSWAAELTSVRNPVSHPPTEDLELPDAVRYLDSARRLLRKIGRPEADQLDNRWHALIGHVQHGTDEELLLDFNLPSRDSVMASFVGRQTYLDELWAWMADPDQKVWALVADGGKGKTTIAYEFTTQVRGTLSRFGLNGFAWVTAKQRRFVDGETVSSTPADFATLDDLLDRILEAYGVTGGSSSRERKAQALAELRSLPMLLIADDIDSLEIDDEDAVQFLQTDVPPTGSKVLLTSRRRPFGLRSVSEVRGMSVAEVAELVEAWRDSLSPAPDPVTNKTLKQIHGLTDGSPLFVEDLLRLAMFTGMEPALSTWTGRAGDAAREYALKRELELLKPDARRLLEVVALSRDSVSLEECCVVLGSITVDDAQISAQELVRWNLISATPIVEDVPRFTISRNLSRLLTAQLKESDRAESIMNGLKQLRGRSVGRGRIDTVIRQAVALQKSGKQAEAEQTLRVGLEESPNASELHAMLGWVLTKWTPHPRNADADEEFGRAESLGGLSSESYYHWASAHLVAKESQQGLRIATRGVDAHPTDPGLWRLKARSESQIGLAASQSASQGAAEARFREADRSLLQAQRLCEAGHGHGHGQIELSRVFSERLRLSKYVGDKTMIGEVLREWRLAIPNDPYRPEDPKRDVAAD
jgi:hypothetical protein